MRVEGERVVLREKRLGDARNDYTWSTDPELCRLDAAQPLALSFEDARALYEEELLYPLPRRQRFAIETKDGVHIGNCMFYDIDSRRGQAELGIMIGDRRYWNKSYGTDAVRALLGYIFGKAGLRRVYLNTLDWNVRAQRAFEKAGFMPLGTARRNSHNFVQMEISKQQWEKLQPAHKAAASDVG